MCRLKQKFPASCFQHFGRQSFLQGDAINIDGHDQSFSKYSRTSSQSNKFAIPLQCLRKKVRDRVHLLYRDKHQGFCKLALLFLMQVARHVQSAQNRNLVIFLQYIKKKVSKRLLCSTVMQNI